MEANDKEIKVVSHYSAPRYETSGAACFDIAIEETYTLNPGELHNFSTGLHVETPKGYCILVFARSSLGQKKCIIPNSVGVIDSDYRGEVFVPIMNLSGQPIGFTKDQRVAQGMVAKAEQVCIRLVSELSETGRSDGGFGSTGE